METILKIEIYEEGTPVDEITGYKITTNKQVVQLYSEKPGFFMSENNLKGYIGANLINITIRDTEFKYGLLMEHSVENYDINRDFIYKGGTLLVDIATSKGTMHFKSYNHHEGTPCYKATFLSEHFMHIN